MCRAEKVPIAKLKDTFSLGRTVERLRLKSAGRKEAKKSRIFNVFYVATAFLDLSQCGKMSLSR
jgi:hypothetical protein